MVAANKNQAKDLTNLLLDNLPKPGETKSSIQQQPVQMPKPEPVVVKLPERSEVQSVVSLVATPKRVNTGAPIQVSWKHTAQPTSSDYVRIYQQGAPNSSYWSNTQYFMIPGTGKREGVLSFDAPQSFGLYEMRYISPNKSGLQLFGTSNLIRVGPEFELTVKPVDQHQVTISIKKTEGEGAPNAWIAVYPARSPNYLEYQWVPKDMDHTFKLPKAGLYLFKLFADKGVDSLVATTEYKVDGDDMLKLDITDNATMIEYKLSTLDASDNVWVGLYLTSEQDQRRSTMYKWIKDTAGAIKMNKPRYPGTYELRLFAYGTHNVLMTSNSFTI